MSISGSSRSGYRPNLPEDEEFSGKKRARKEGIEEAGTKKPKGPEQQKVRASKAQAIEKIAKGKKQERADSEEEVSRRPLKATKLPKDNKTGRLADTALHVTKSPLEAASQVLLEYADPKSQESVKDALEGLFALLPEHVDCEVVIQALKKTVHFPADRCRRIQEITQILAAQTPEERLATLSEAKKLFMLLAKHPIPMWMLLTILDTKNVRQRESLLSREDVIELAEQMTYLIQNGLCDNVHLVFEPLSKMNPGVFDEIKESLPKIANGVELRNLLKRIEEFKAEDGPEIRKYLTYAKPFFALCSSGHAQIFVACLSMSRNDAQKVLAHTRTLINKGTTGAEIAWILHTINSYNEKELVNVKDAIRVTRAFVLHTFRHGNALLSDPSIQLLFDQILKLPFSRRQEILSAAKPLLPTDISLYGAAVIIESISTIPPSQRKNVLKLAMPFIKNMTNNPDKAALIVAIGSLHPDIRSSVLTRAAPYIHSVSPIRELFSLISNTSSDEWNTLLQQAAPFLEQADRLKVLQAIHEIPQDTREETLKRCLPFVQALQKRDLTPRYIEVIAKIPLDQLENVLQHADRLLNNPEPGEELRINLIEVIGRLTPSNRRVILDLVQAMCQYGFAINTFLRNFMPNIPADQQVAMLTQTQAIVQQWGSQSRFARVLETLANVPTRARDALFERIGPNLANLATYQERYALFETTIDELFSETGFRVTVSRSELTENPRKALDDFIQKLARELVPKHSLYVQFTGEAGIDASGLSKEFISLLFMHVTSTLHLEKSDNGLFLPKLPMSDEDKKTYANLGAFMMFCLNAWHEYPTGMVFDRGFFVALTQLKPKHLHQPCSELVATEEGFQELLDIYVHMKSPTNATSADMQRLKAYAGPFTVDTPEDTLKDAYEYAMLAYEDDMADLTIDNLKDNLPKLQQAVRQYIIETTLMPYLVPIIEVAKGMESSPYGADVWQSICAMNADRLSEKIQGRLTKELVIAKLKFENVPPEKQDWLLEWIHNASQDSLKTFVYGMTGSYALGTKDLTVSAVNAVFYHTCFNRVDLPFELMHDQEAFNHMLNNSLQNLGRYTSV